MLTNSWKLAKLINHLKIWSHLADFLSLFLFSCALAWREPPKTNKIAWPEKGTTENESYEGGSRVEWYFFILFFIFHVIAEMWNIKNYENVNIMVSIVCGNIWELQICKMYHNESVVSRINSGAIRFWTTRIVQRKDMKTYMAQEGAFRQVPSSQEFARKTMTYKSSLQPRAS